MCDGCNHSMGVSRRGLLIAGTVMSSAAMLSQSVLAQSSSERANAIPPDEALKRIMAGNARYAANTARNKDFSAGRAARAAKQFPIAAILSCADSRLSPELAFDQGPGELFVVRLAGNFVNDDGLASIEYGLKFLGIPLVVVLGHSNCGAVSATIKVVKDGAELPGHLPDLVNSIRPAVEVAIAKKPADLLGEATVENVRHNVRRLAAAEPIVNGLIKDQKIKIVGGVYDIASGKVNLL
jgi:carbonic anhydrase